MYVDNLISFGRLLNTDKYLSMRKHNDMYEMITNRLVSVYIERMNIVLHYILSVALRSVQLFITRVALVPKRSSVKQKQV